ncbi:Gfo/Idh/MocA family protein [Occultella gossypii]|uniref:Gfo/Idh/MocA family oxidoreductase n=1 Tax=Occultella gossypii TaxID=2800820 RepID=A0ABS7S9Z7_9MICO|nr:Gfo/Idh/MocA family oxidoreductase [Occultella gossypii]MBZ2197162.1 Gfo/Idh/MocA family oxidoreductase [Occultella gossypii]
MTRYAIIGTGSRARMYIDALLGPFDDAGELVAWCEPNPGRLDRYDELVAQTRPGAPLPARYLPADLEAMITSERVDRVILTSPDHTHADLVARALTAGADVVVEKPLTTDLPGCERITDAVAATGRSLVLTFNYRYSPRNGALKDVIDSGRIGTVTSMHFEWALDTAHGADYFRRWHRDRANSGGLLVHKASHHFDLVNWWLADSPAWVFAAGDLRFYGRDNALARGLPERPARGTVDPPTRDPFALDLRTDPELRRLYYEAEHHDGYLRDVDVFSAGISIEDNMSVMVGYDRGPVLTYSLNAHSPWEGYRVTANGTEGRAELEVVERSAVVPDADGHPILDANSPANVAGADGVRARGQRLLVQRHWEVAQEVPIPTGEGGHGGGDGQLLTDVFRGPAVDPLGRPAGLADGLRSVLVGIAANGSRRTGARVDIADLLAGTSVPAALAEPDPARP